MATRVVNVTSGEPYTVYIGRRNNRYGLPESKWANPYRARSEGNVNGILPTREDAIAQFRAHLLGRPDLLAALPELRGQVLACWCAPPGGVTASDPLVCHGQVLAEMADAEPAAWARTAAVGGGE